MQTLNRVENNTGKSEAKAPKFSFSLQWIKDAHMESEYTKFGLLRIVLGVIILFRLCLNCPASLVLFPPEVVYGGLTGQFLGCVLLIPAAILYSLGFLTPLTSLVLLFGVYSFDKACSMLTLGTTLLNATLILFLMVNCGARVSLDSWILRNRPNSLLGQIVKAMHSVVGVPSFKQLNTYLFLSFMLYGLISIGALLFHVQDRYWAAGETVRVALSCTYLSRFPDLFRWVESFAPWAILLFSQMSGIGQSIFQAFMIPLSFTKWGRWFVIVWGAAFCVISIVALQLSYLPYTEIVLWTALFYRPRWKRVSYCRSSELKAPDLVFKAYIVAISICSIIFISNFPVVCTWPGASWIVNTLGEERIKDLYYFGYNVPNVFNEQDLAMSSHWYMLQRNGNPNDTVPLNDYTGARGWLHNSDIVYFSTALVWRRMMGFDEKNALRSPDYYTFIKKVADMDRRMTGFKGYYQVVVYKDKSSTVELPAAERFKVSVIDQYRIEAEPEKAPPPPWDVRLSRFFGRLESQVSRIFKHK